MIFWKNFTNIDRLVTKVGSNEAPGCTYDYEAVRSRCDDHDGARHMVLVTWCSSHFGRCSEANWRMERQHMEELDKMSETRTERKETRAESLGVPHLLWGLNSLGTLAYL